MPSYVAHTMFGETVRERLPEAQRSSGPDRCPVAFQWGAQGPDLLFFYNGFRKGPNPIGDCGAKMHKTCTPQLFAALRRYLTGLRDTPEFAAAWSYACGFLCHYALDKTVHPYVYFMQEKKRGQYHSSLPYGIHMKLETDMDTALYRRATGKNIRWFKMDPALVKRREELEALARTQAYLLQEVYGQRYSPEDILQCVENDYRKEKLIFDPTYLRSYLFLRGIELSRGEKNTQCANCRPNRVRYDVLNLEKQPWKNFREKDVERRESVPELFELAAAEAVSLIQEMDRLVQEDREFVREAMPTFDDGNPDVFGR